ncbi:MAG: hypothetical protein QXT86_12760 [Archaeoglobaceae archaeon]
MRYCYVLSEGTDRVFAKCGLKKSLFDYLSEFKSLGLLVSYYTVYRREGFRDKFLKYVNAFGDRVILDSGAFQIYVKKKLSKIDERKYFEDYVSFLKETDADRRYWYVVFDVVGDDRKSFERYKLMREMGCKNVIPVWHSASRLEYLDYYYENAPYLAFALTLGVRRENSRCYNDWVMRLFSFLFDRYGEEFFLNRRIHLLGYFSKLFFELLPADSCDSALYLDCFRLVLVPWGDAVRRVYCSQRVGQISQEVFDFLNSEEFEEIRMNDFGGMDREEMIERLKTRVDFRIVFSTCVLFRKVAKWSIPKEEKLERFKKRRIKVFDIGLRWEGGL